MILGLTFVDLFKWIRVKRVEKTDRVMGSSRVERPSWKGLFWNVFREYDNLRTAPTPRDPDGRSVLKAAMFDSSSILKQ